MQSVVKASASRNSIIGENHHRKPGEKSAKISIRRGVIGYAAKRKWRAARRQLKISAAIAKKASISAKQLSVVAMKTLWRKNA